MQLVQESAIAMKKELEDVMTAAAKANGMDALPDR